MNPVADASRSKDSDWRVASMAPPPQSEGCNFPRVVKTLLSLSGKGVCSVSKVNDKDKTLHNGWSGWPTRNDYEISQHSANNSTACGQTDIVQFTQYSSRTRNKHFLGDLYSTGMSKRIGA